MCTQITRSISPTILWPIAERENKNDTGTITKITGFLKLSLPLWLYQGKTLDISFGQNPTQARNFYIIIKTSTMLIKNTQKVGKKNQIHSVTKIYNFQKFLISFK